MKTIKQFNKNNLAEMREAVNKALLKVSDDYNVNFKIGRINFEPAGFSTKLEASLVVDGKVQTKEARDFNSLAEMYGCKFPLNFRFSYGNDTYVVDGLKPRSRKYPITATSQKNNTSYKFTMDIVNHQYEVQKIKAELIG